MNSETPETDQQAHWTTFEDGFWGVERCSAETGTWVPIDFARRLELRCKRLEEALDVFARLYYLNKPLNLSEDRPLIEILPRVWPVFGDLKRAAEALTPPTTI